MKGQVAIVFPSNLFVSFTRNFYILLYDKSEEYSFLI